MIALLLGAATLAVMMGALGMFSRAQIVTIKQFGVWVVAIGGLILAALLFLTGRGAVAIAALGLLGPMVWAWMAPGGRPAQPPPRMRAQRGGMSRAEAFQVLGLPEGASASDIRAAHRRLMAAAHPDRGGSDWLASRINQARDTLLG
jgi:hypothetical protein